MLIVIANQYNTEAAVLVARWRSVNACLLTATDLSIAGWCLPVEEPAKATVVASGRKLTVNSIRGVLVRMPYVVAEDLPHIMPSERSYVASEMTALLAAWLSQLACPVVNRPTPTCLLGPAWAPERWTATAARLGIPVQPVYRHCRFATNPAPSPAESSSVVVTVIGKRCFGARDQTMAAQSLCLAEAAGVDLLAAEFSLSEAGVSFLWASPWPSLVSEEVSAAVLELLLARQAQAQDSQLLR